MSKTTLPFLCLILFFAFGCTVQDHVLAPLELKSNKYVIISNGPNTSNYTLNFMMLQAKNDGQYQGENVSKVRTLLDFDWSQIPSGASIKTAKLSLFFNPLPNAGGTFLFHEGDNGFSIERATSAWMPATSSWGSEPSVTSDNRVLIAPSTDSHQDYPDMDVTELVKDMVKTGNMNGFRLKLLAEGNPRFIMWASPNHENPALRPKLVITFN